MKLHNYTIKTEWTGNKGLGTFAYNSYSRNHEISTEGKYEKIMGSSDSAFMGDKDRYSPEDLFLSSLSACHMLWYLHLCTVNDIIVLEYTDNATAKMEEAKDGAGKFTEVVLNPVVKIAAESNTELAKTLHKEANEKCFIANSCNFEIQHNATILV